MLPEKNALSLEQIDEQSALELPERALTFTLNSITVSPVIETVTLTQSASAVQLNLAGLVGGTQANSASISQAATAFA